MRKLVESTFVTLGGDIGSPQVWGPAYLNCADGGAYNRDLLFGADCLLLGRKTYEGLSAAYTAMTAATESPQAAFIDRMNAIPKYVASTTLAAVDWNSTLLSGDVVERVAELKDQPGRSILKYGTGSLDRTLLEHHLIDELHIWIVPVTTGPGQRLLQDVGDLGLQLVSSTTLSTGVVVLKYRPQ